MKPANHIEIQRNVYTFSAIVLVLSVLIGSSAWTLSSTGVGRIVKERDDAVSANLIGETLRTTLEKDIARLGNEKRALQKKIDDTQRDKLSEDLDKVIGYMSKAQAAAGEQTRATYSKQEPWKQTDTVDQKAQEVFNTFMIFYANHSDAMKIKDKEIETTQKINPIGAGERNGESKSIPPPVDCSQCQEELATSNAKLKDAIKPILLKMKTELTLLKGVKFSDNARFKVGQYDELINLTIPPNPNAADANMILSAFKSVCNCIVNYPKDCAQDDPKSLK